MLYLFNDFLDFTYVFEGVVYPSNLCLVNSEILGDESALLFFDDKVWFKVLANKLAFRLTADPLPNREISSFVAGDASFDAFLNLNNGLRECIEDRNPGIIGILNSFGSLLVFIDTEITITVHKSRHPLPKSFVWFNGLRNSKFFFSARRWFFKNRKLVSVFWSKCALFFSGFIKKIQKKIAAFFFNDTEWCYSGNKILKITTLIIYPPFITNLVNFFRTFIDNSTKFSLKSLKSWFMGHLDSYNYFSGWCYRYPALCVKKTCEIMHDFLLIVLGIVTHYHNKQSPATTKREEPRINSSVCNSLIHFERFGGWAEEPVPPLDLPLMVSKRKLKVIEMSTLKTVSSEWGSINNVRVMLSSVGSVEPNASRIGNSVYNVFVQGLESLGIVEQDNYTAKFLYRPPVFSDPLFQNVTLGTVFAQVPRILNDLWLTKMRCTLR